MSNVLEENSTVWNTIAAGMQRAAQVGRDSIFPDGELIPRSLPEFARIPYVGWVGPCFSGTLIVGKNPGGGGDAQSVVKPHDRDVADALCNLRDAPASGVVAALRRVYEAYAAQSPTIGMGSLMGRVLEALGEKRDEVAFLNLCPFRTRNDADFSAASARRCIHLVVSPLVEALQPDTVILLGRVASTAAPQLNARWIYKVKRRINDHQLHPEAALRLDEMQSSREERAALHQKRCLGH